MKKFSKKYNLVKVYYLIKKCKHQEWIEKIIRTQKKKSIYDIIFSHFIIPKPQRIHIYIFFLFGCDLKFKEMNMKMMEKYNPCLIHN